MVGCCYDADGTLSQERLRAFLAAYHAARPLAEAERAALRGSMLGAVRDPLVLAEENVWKASKEEWFPFERSFPREKSSSVLEKSQCSGREHQNALARH